MRRNPSTWSARQLDAMHWLQRSTLKSARAWRLKMALRACTRATAHNSIEQAASDLRAWLSWARRCRLEPFKKLAATLKERFDAVVRGMVDHRSNAFVEAMNGLLQQAGAPRAASGRARTSSPSPTCACPSSSTCRPVRSRQPCRHDAAFPHKTA
jgi:transposase